MNQIISYIKVKNKKIIIFFYFQLIISIIVVFILFIGIFKNRQNFNFQVSNSIKTNLKLAKIYNSSSNKYIGNLIIKKINLEYPVFKEYSEENLKISVCKFSGNNLNENGNITILGHNYINRFFGNLEKLEINDEIIIDSIGEKFEYLVFKIYDTDSDDLDCLKPIYNDSKEITLITCKENSKKKRLVVKAIKKE